MRVLKFGGTSMGTAKSIGQIADIAINKFNQDKKIAIVVSAIGGATDILIGMANDASLGITSYKEDYIKLYKRHADILDEILERESSKNESKYIDDLFEELAELLHGIYLMREVTPKAMDLIMSFGERLSTYLLVKAINKRKKPADVVDARELVKTDSSFGLAKVDFRKTNKNIKKFFSNMKYIPIVTGFVASDDSGLTTTLGRGGSDYTAAIFAAALEAFELEIWTDVDGVMTANPKQVSKAFPIATMTYEEAMELSHFGAKVIHPPTMKPVMDKKIGIRIKNTFNPDAKGTLISDLNTKNEFAIKGISSMENVVLIRMQGGSMVGIPGISMRLFGSLAREKVSVILISQGSSEHSICFAITEKDLKMAKKTIENEFELEMQVGHIDPLKIEKDVCIVAVVGENMKSIPGVAGHVFSSLGRNGVNIISIAQGSSELNISFVINKKDEAKALNAIHETFFLSQTKVLNCFLVGPGLIGGTLLKQIHNQANYLKNEHDVEVKLIGLADSKKMLFDSEGISIANWKKELSKSRKKMNIKDFTRKMNEFNLQNSVFVDCTSNESIGAEYINILKSNIHIVTPNKKANSSKWQDYQNMKEISIERNIRFLYETNVGAGLPVISTLNDILKSGDSIIKVEAVLSGTLSYIFNSFVGSKSFSEIVKEAREKGYTEPDPRDDLNGMDVARKILILAREIGLKMELGDIDVENLVPEPARNTKSIDDFFKQLKGFDKEFDLKKKKAAKNNYKLCYIATLENGKAKVNLQEVGSSHPFYSLSGSDNIISFTTNRYNKCPLVVKGPGAGADVTAAGVFADIIRISKSIRKIEILKTTPKRFEQDLKRGRLLLSIVGMSNVGKTFWSNKLSKIGFQHVNCDDRIEDEIRPELKKLGYKGIADMAKWLGQPYDKQFRTNQKKYLDLEIKTMQEVFDEFEKGVQNMIIDTTGSVIYTGEEMCTKLKRSSIIIYIEATPEMKAKMFKNFIKHPKPLIWGKSFDKNKGESNVNSLERCYPKLLEYRSSFYNRYADVVIPYEELSGDMDGKEFLRLVKKYL